MPEVDTISLAQLQRQYPAQWHDNTCTTDANMDDAPAPVRAAIGDGRAEPVQLGGPADERSAAGRRAQAAQVAQVESRGGRRTGERRHSRSGHRRDQR